MKHYTHFTPEERDQLFDLLQIGLKQYQIAEVIRKSPSAVSRELNNNSTVIDRRLNNSPRKACHYLPDKAQKKYESRRKHSKYSFPLKSPEIHQYVVEHLTSFQNWSPEQISGRIEMDIGKAISPECIYQFIYSKRARHLRLWEFLRRRHSRRRKKHGRKPRKSPIPNRRDISLRPAKVETRKQAGHWEGDSIVGKGKGPALHTEVERMSRMTFVRKLRRKTSDEVKKAMVSIFKSQPSSMRRTITLDNGPEHAGHEKVTKKIGSLIFFARPYASWQRGTNENTNGLIRQYFPKGTDFECISLREIRKVQDAINNRPRKCLGFRKPIEIYSHYLATPSEKIAFQN